MVHARSFLRLISRRRPDQLAGELTTTLVAADRDVLYMMAKVSRPEYQF